MSYFIGVETGSRADFKAVCSDKENININIFSF